MRLKPLLAALALIASVWALQAAQANFGDAAGFSGRSGATCVQCHVPTAVGYEPATAVLEGVPPSWNVGQAYLLTVRVEGGPRALPPPAAQGGFALASSGGHFQLAPGTEALLQLAGPYEVTYLPEGTRQREWETIWVAPDLAQQPQSTQLWLAVLSANGNHVIAAGDADDGGERLDSGASLTVVIPPSADASAAWRALPLAEPTATVDVDGSAVTLDGRHGDGNATRLLFRLDGGVPQVRDTAATWKLAFQGLSGGRHTVTLWSEGAERASPPVAVTFEVQGGFDPLHPRETPGPSATAGLLALTFLVAILRRTPQ